MQPHRYGYGGGKQKSLWKWYAINLLEKIDLPGEYFLDRESGILHVYPPHDLSQAHIQLSLLDGAFISTKGAEHVRIEGLVFENGRADGILMEDATDNVVAGCTLRNLGGQGVNVKGTGNTVLSCDVYGLGSRGVSVNGGDRRTLTPAGNVVRNCDIHHLIDEMSDQGAIYMGRNPSQTGNIFRFNFFYHTATTHVRSYGNSGIFFDDGDSGQHVFGNVFYKTGSNGAVKYHGGQFNEFVNNIVVDCKVTVRYQLWDQERWDKFLQEESMQNKLLKEVNILEPPYSTRYPKLAKIFESPYTQESHIEERNYATTADDPVFVDGANLNFRIRDLEAVQAKVPGFESISFEKMGLYADQYRK